MNYNFTGSNGQPPGPDSGHLSGYWLADLQCWTVPLYLSGQFEADRAGHFNLAQGTGMAPGLAAG